ncbi:MAG: ABC transporter permease [Chloroflexi bacterium]|nr:ABC transporter permease [Chloroflexota bacterium]
MRLLNLASRNLKETYRDPVALAFLLGFPLVFMVLFGAMFGRNTDTSYPVGVIDEDKTIASEAFVNQALAGVPSLKLVTYTDTAKALKDLKLGDLRAYLVIPSGFGVQVSQNWQGKETDIILQMTYDESNPSLSQQLIATMNTATRAFARIEIPVTVKANPIHIETEITVIDFTGPGIIIFGLMILIPTSARVLVRDKEKGFLARLLTTPLRPFEFIASYSLSLIAIAIAQIIIFVAVAHAFGMDIVGNLGLAFLILLLAGLSSIGIGMVVGSLSKSENQSEALCWLFSMPLSLLSGAWFSSEMLPQYLKNAANAFPYAHAIAASRAVLIRGVGLEATGKDVLFLVGWTVVIFGLGIILFRRSMRR